MKFRLFPQSLLNWNLSKVVDRNCGNCWSIFVLFWISPPMTLEDTIKFQEDPKIITILWKKTTWNMKTAPKMNNDIKREGNQNCKWSAVFTIRFPKKIDWDWQWQFHHFHFISFHLFQLNYNHSWFTFSILQYLWILVMLLLGVPPPKYF